MDKFSQFASEVDFSKTSFQIALVSIAFNPTFWNIAARVEYKTHLLTKLALGKPKLGCYLLAIIIFSIGLLRDFLYEKALSEQPVSTLLLTPYAKALGALSFGFGNILVLSSMYKLGITGTYLGDYFGILMDDRVTDFPFNVTNNPMYNGSFLCFLGTALWYGKPAGIFASAFVHVMYSIALKFEEPFTAKIYALRDAKKE
ncbi:unnamed protein product [Kuraishia capsulata CBS 1993]|uniref:Phosphatidyl-N-methylethanolamine N-methyltransferase n=1 Tax=Kuraishia capsulata CBS 1993 TaxID=1382522 RepID=W6MNB9_9ASCO|nr:uncharacterized protein KUCA_T00002479001 [Kuraishia capsulata CBS 1993]CDK26507.1 unnamed protein product [Kuraishia capsulata CBS 1993]